MDRLEALKLRREQADAYSEPRKIDSWGARVAWFAISEGAVFTRSVCNKYNQKSKAWAAYQNLVASGLLIEGEGLLYTPHPQWETGDDGPMQWFEALAKVAAGGERHPLL